MATPVPTFYANPNPVYKPAMRLITGITNAYPAVVTTSFPHGYKTQMILRLYVPNGFGMVQANQLFGSIVVIDDTNFSIDIDTRYFDVFANPGTNFSQTAMSVPIGEDTSTVYWATVNVLPSGQFQSP